MSTDESPSAFPVHSESTHVTEFGMSLRDYFAGQVLSGLIIPQLLPITGWQADVAWDAYSVADAMIAERKKAT